MRALAAEALGTFFLLATVVGSGIMGEALSGGNDAIALLANSIATGAILYVLITGLGPISGAHFNPVVSGVMWWRGQIVLPRAVAFVAVQVIAGASGVVAANLMFGLDPVSFSTTARSGAHQWLSEGIATFGLIATILLVLRARPQAVAGAVGLYITAAYWFTSSTSFANPAVTLARTLSDTFAGIAPGDAPAFVAAQVVGAGLAALIIGWLVRDRDTDSPR